MMLSALGGSALAASDLDGDGQPDLETRVASANQQSGGDPTAPTEGREETPVVEDQRGDASDTDNPPEPGPEPELEPAMELQADEAADPGLPAIALNADETTPQGTPSTTSVTVRALTTKQSMGSNHWATDTGGNHPGLRFGAFLSEDPNAQEVGACVFKTRDQKACTMFIDDALFGGSSTGAVYIRHTASDPDYVDDADIAYNPRVTATKDYIKRAKEGENGTVLAPAYNSTWDDWQQRVDLTKGRAQSFPTKENLKKGVDAVNLNSRWVEYWDWDEPNYQSFPDGYGIAARLENPHLGAQTDICNKGLDVAIVADVSGSTRQYIATYRNAVKAFVQALADAPGDNRAAVFNFSDRSPAAEGGNPANIPQLLDVKNETSKTRLDNWANALTAATSTNWDHPLHLVDKAMDDGTAHYDLVLFLSDGNPNTLGTAQNVRAGKHLSHFEETVLAGNAVKEHGTRVIGQRIKGDNDWIPSAHIRGISGTVEYADGMGLNDFDFSKDNEFNQLADTLRKYVENTLICHFDVHVEKEVDDKLKLRGPEDWNFQLGVPSDVGAALEYDPLKPGFDPNLVWGFGKTTAPHNPYVPTGPPMTTDLTGKDWMTVLLKDTSRFPLTLWEDTSDLEPDEWTTDATCSVKRAGIPDPIPLTMAQVTPDPVAKRVNVTFPAPTNPAPADDDPNYSKPGDFGEGREFLFGHEDVVTCKFVNSRPNSTLKVDKLWTITQNGENPKTYTLDEVRSKGFDAGLELSPTPQGRADQGAFGRVETTYDDVSEIGIAETPTWPTTCAFTKADLYATAPDGVAGAQPVETTTALEGDRVAFGPKPYNRTARNLFTVVNEVDCSTTLTMEKKVNVPDLIAGSVPLLPETDWHLSATDPNGIVVAEGAGEADSSEILTDGTYVLKEEYRPAGEPWDQAGNLKPSWKCSFTDGGGAGGGAGGEEIAVKNADTAEASITISGTDTYRPIHCVVTNSAQAYALLKHTYQSAKNPVGNSNRIKWKPEHWDLSAFETNPSRESKTVGAKGFTSSNVFLGELPDRVRLKERRTNSYGPGGGSPGWFYASVYQWDFTKQVQGKSPDYCDLRGAQLGAAVKQEGHLCWTKLTDLGNGEESYDKSSISIAKHDGHPTIIRFLNTDENGAVPPPPFDPVAVTLPLTGGMGRELPIMVGAVILLAGIGTALRIRYTRRHQ